MGKNLKPNRIVILLGGRFAGRKAVVVKSYDDGAADRQYGHSLVAGIDKYPRKVTKVMGKKRVEKRLAIRPFIKVINHQHLLPTRHTFDPELDKGVVNKDSIKEPKKKKLALATVKKAFMSHHKSEKNKWFFTPLRF